MKDLEIGSSSRVSKGMPRVFVELSVGALVLLLIGFLASPVWSAPKAVHASAGLTVDDNGKVSHIVGPTVSLCDFGRDLKVDLVRAKLTLRSPSGGGLCKPGDAPTMVINTKACSFSGTSYDSVNLSCS